ncbi:deaminase domain-containing protein [Priestia aryabhattai]|uniref:deaminase domain-containing protein n=1 Tax=Priestia aryabhattai TaxID=412384 RepID=UPI0021AD560C|nr:deaminase domain-containing protein [Priestia aryabhattai]
MNERGEKSFDSLYDFVNHVTMGLLDVGQQALNPDKPLSKEHWENSMFLFASVIGGAKPAGTVKSVPKVTNVPRVPAHKATKILSDMRNVISPKAASNWSKKVYEPVQKKLQPLLDAEIPTLRPQPQLVGIGEALPGKTFGEALNGLTTYKMGNVSKGPSKALEKVEKSGGKANVEGVYDQAAVSKGTGKVYPTRQIDSVAEAHIIDRVKELRGNLSSKYKKAGNFALAEVDVNSLNKREFYASSKIDEFKGNLEEKVPEISLKPNEPIFEASLAPGKDGKPYMRDSDTEYKILNEIALKLGNDVNATGEIKLFTELDTCDSCSKVIAEFADKYKNIKLEVIHNNGERLKP